MKKLWRIQGDSLKPVLVDCPNGYEYPATDIDGCTIYVNSHFLREEDAWSHLLKNAEASVYMTGSAVEEAEKLLQQKDRQAAIAAKRFVKIQDNFTDWQITKGVALSSLVALDEAMEEEGDHS